MSRVISADASIGIQDAADDIDVLLRERFFAPEPTRPGLRRALPDTKVRPEHYKVICISMYLEDIERVDAAVAELKKRGHTKASRSSVFRAAMLQLDLDRVPRGI